jgi:glucose-6-phosphate isomerase
MPINFNFNNFVQNSSSPKGLNTNDLTLTLETKKTIQQDIEEKRGRDGYEVMNLLYPEEEELSKIIELVEDTNNKFESLVVIGIGGSIIGAQMIHQSLGRESKKVSVKFIGDTTEPEVVLHVLRDLSIEKTLFNVVSKSGDTLEPIMSFYVIRDFLVNKVGEGWSKNFVFTTRTSDSYLYSLAQAHNIRILSVPPQVSGRFSVLSNVGLFPAAYMGVNLRDLLRGAGDMDKLTASSHIDNPMLNLAEYMYLAATKQNRNISVLFSYVQALAGFGNWWRQLWAESLGKKNDRNGDEIRTGLTPIVAIGPSDQHSQLQLYTEGPLDKTIIFLNVQDRKKNLFVPSISPGDKYEYLGGKSFADVVGAQLIATQEAVSCQGQLAGEIILSELDDKSLGSLIYFFEMVVIYLAEFYQINPFDQPGVEYGKIRTKELLEKNRN